MTVITSVPNYPEGRVQAGYRNVWRQVETMAGIRVVRVWTFVACTGGAIRRTLDYVSYMMTAMLAAMGEKRPDVVVGTSPPFFAAAAAWVTAALRRRPFVFEVRDLWPESILEADTKVPGVVLRLLERMELFLYSRAEAIVVVTEAFRQDLVRRGVPASKIHVVRNGVDPGRFAPRPRDRDLAAALGIEGKFVAGYLGTFGVAQDLWTLLAAAERLKDRPEIAFLFAGAGTEWQRMQQRIEEAGIENVRLLPQQAKDGMPALWSCCDLCLVPLCDEPVFRSVIPSKFFEAMGMGIPVLLATPEGEATGILRDAECGSAVPPGDAAALAAAIERLASAPGELEKMAQRAYAASRSFDRERAAEAMLAVIEPAARAGGRG